MMDSKIPCSCSKRLSIVLGTLVITVSCVFSGYVDFHPRIKSMHGKRTKERISVNASANVAFVYMRPRHWLVPSWGEAAVHSREKMDGWIIRNCHMDFENGMCICPDCSLTGQ